MQSIYKFKLGKIGRTCIETKIVRWLSVGYDPEGDICIWAIVDLDAEKERYNIFEVGTGWIFEQDVLKDMEFIGTVNEGPYMWHVFVNQQDRFE